jgi:murein tripeptide amidase MpaA
MMSEQSEGPIARLDTGFYNLVEVTQACKNLAARYSALATLITLPFPTHAGNTSHALRLSGTAQRAGKPAFMLIGGVHGCEWGSSEILLYLASHLLGAYHAQVPLYYGPDDHTFTAAEVTTLLDTFDIVLFPLVNPDGLQYSRTLGAPAGFRKNRNLGNAAQQDQRDAGVDLNRNFDFLFDFGTAFAQGTGVSVSTDPLHENYQGATAFSEPETKNVRCLVKQHPGTRCFVDLHTRARDVIYPWSDDETQSYDGQMTFMDSSLDGQRGLPDDRYREYLDPADRQAMVALGNAFAAGAVAAGGAAYAVIPSFEFAPSCGTSHDWVYSRQYLVNANKTLALAVEWFDEDQISPMWHEMPPHIESVCAGLIAMGLALLPAP